MNLGVKKQLKHFQHQPAGQKSSQGELNIALYHEKCVQEAINKLLTTKKEACKAWLSWARLEENAVASELFKRVMELEHFHIESYQDFFTEYEHYRSYFKEILKGEKLVDDSRKTFEDSYTKVKQLQKKIDALSSKNADKKLENYSTEMGRLLSEQRQKEAAWTERKKNHEQFKIKSFKDAVQSSTDAYIKLHERCFEVFQTQRLVLDFYTATTYSKLTAQVLQEARQNGDCLIADLQKKLGFGELSVLENIKSASAVDELADFLGESSFTHEEEEDTYNPIPEYNDEPFVRDEVIYEDEYMVASLEDSQNSSRSNSRTLSHGGSQRQRPLPPVPQSDEGTEEVYSDPAEMFFPDASTTTSPPILSPGARPTAPPPAPPSSTPSAPPVPPRRNTAGRMSLQVDHDSGEHPYLDMELSASQGPKRGGSVKQGSTYMQMAYPRPLSTRDGSSRSTGSGESEGGKDSGIGESFKSRQGESQEDLFGSIGEVRKAPMSDVEYEYKLWEQTSNYRSTQN